MPTLQRDAKELAARLSAEMKRLEQARAEIPSLTAPQDPYLANIDARNRQTAEAEAERKKREGPLLGDIHRIDEALVSVLGPNEPSLETCQAAAQTLAVAIPAFKGALESSGLLRRPIADFPPPDEFCKDEADWWKGALLQGKDETTIRDSLRRGDRTKLLRTWRHLASWTTSPIPERPAKAPDTPASAQAAEKTQAIPAKRTGRKKPAGTTIPPEKRTRPMTYREAARYLGKGDSKDAAEWVSVGVEVGDLDCEHFSRQQHIFNREQFPMETWQHIVPK
jgi:hypothetical protein